MPGGLAAVLAVVEQRGLSLRLDGDRPVLRGPKGEATPALLEALAAFREEVVEWLRANGPPPRPDLIQYRTATNTVFLAILAPREGLAPLPGAQGYWSQGNVPYGAVAWRVPPAEEWRPLEQLPEHWGLKRFVDDEPQDERTCSLRSEHGDQPAAP